jgi:hypothetical protein
MESRYEIERQRVAKLIPVLYSLEFPKILIALRNALGISRKSMSLDTKIEYFRLLSFESGNFSLGPNKQELRNLAKYFDVPYEILCAKLEDWTGR